MTRLDRARAIGAIAIVILTGCAHAHERRGIASRSRCTGERSYACLGALRVSPYALATIAQASDWRRTVPAIELAARLDMRQAVPLLRALLAPNVEPRTRSAAALALVELGDHESGPAIAALLRELEEATYPISWDECARALFAVDRGAALEYAHDWMQRHPALESRAEEARAFQVIEVLRATNDDASLPALRAWMAPFENVDSEEADFVVAHVLAARLQFGDEPLRSRIQAQLVAPEWTIVPALPEIALDGLGYDANDAMGLAMIASTTGLEARVAYDGIDRLVPLLSDAQRAALVARMSEYTSVREDPSHPNYSPRLLVRHHASLARLGHAPSAARLAELAGQADGSMSSVIAAREALALGLPGAADAVYATLAAGRTAREELAPREDRLALLDRAAAQMGSEDGRWAVAVLDPQLDERALYHLARLRPASACDAVFPVLASGGTLERQVRPALTALTTLGDACRPHLEQLVSHPRAPAVTRGAALEVLARLRAPSTPMWIRRFADEPGMRLSARAALDIFTAD